MLSDRMRAVAALALPCSCIADIGCDHGYVAIELIRSNACDKVIAMDVKKAPLERAKGNIRNYGMQDAIETRLSDGAAALLPNEADGIICAGMGGRLVISIMERSQTLVRSMKQLVLQPQSELCEVRRYLRLNGYAADKEDIVFEDGKYYPMMRAIPLKDESIRRTDDRASEKLIRVRDTYGPCLLENAHPVLKEYILWQKANFEDIREKLKNAGQMSSRQKQRIGELDEALSDIEFCLCNYF